MANYTVTPENVCQTVAVLKTQFQHFDKKLDGMCVQVNTIYDSMPEMIRKVNAHHKTFREDQVLIKKIDPIEKDVAELKKQNPANDDGDERRQSAWGRMQWWKKFSIISGIIVVLLRPEIKEVVQAIAQPFKTYLGIE